MWWPSTLPRDVSVRPRPASCILGTGHYARILAKLQGGAPHVTSHLEEAGKVRRIKNVLGSDGNSIERVVRGRRKPVYNYVDFMTRFSSAE